MTLKFDGWPWKTIGHLYDAMSSFVHHFKAIGEFKLELAWKRSIRVEINYFLSCVTLKFDKRPRKRIVDFFYATSKFVHHFVANSEFKLELQSKNAQLG